MSPRFLLRFLCILVLSASAISSTPAQNAPLPSPVLSENALLTVPVGGLERTGASSEIVGIAGQPFSRALRVTITKEAPETNATQITIPNALPLQKGDALVATLWARGQSARKTPAQLQFLFEKATTPWTKSVVSDIVTPAGATKWKRFVIPFESAADFAPGEAMASFRFAFGPQVVEIAGLSLISYGKTKTAEQLTELVAAQNPLGKVEVKIDLTKGAQKLGGFGGNFAQPRYGETVPMDAVGQFNLDNLKVTQARIGIPLQDWTPQRGVFKDEGTAHAALLQAQIFAKRGIPVIGSVWEGPTWMIGGAREQGGKILPRERYEDCIEAVAQFLVTSRDKYNAPIAYFSFNEADLGINFKFTPAQIADFIALAGPRFRALGLETKFLVGDTANGGNLSDYARPLLENAAIAPYLGPIAFHSWDALGASETKYREIAALGAKYGKEIWCTEAGHDAQLWQRAGAFATWENALRTALAYERTLRLSGAHVMDYWTYQDNYPLVSKDGKTPFPVWNVMRNMELALAKGNRIVAAQSSNDDLKVIAARGPVRGQFSLVLINPAGAGEVKVSGLPKNVALFSVANSATLLSAFFGNPPSTDSQGSATFWIPARSVLTFTSLKRIQIF